ncbi:uncharacterized protein SETTUDRAFT_158518 [Exserohilum turcica Et28A]|uniref:Protein kinase domain-containing protein n=1 Tax=Exserohilum turcicum (strain 28A) TaxID=671987 RepID=R0J264_EXST2|nr:uncharacterized protein SETTUDRAFT_158518 [Exserohilum turcica Et28A]EOA91045.1 hypothetical protein SETTUDRAFT_158518 [Exserohilum turcica Et28A]
MNFCTTKIDLDKPFEEERLPWYSPDQFYPVRIGEILDSSYKVFGKLGYGAYPTVWLCRSIRDAGFVAIKICTQDINRSARFQRELKFYEHVSSLSTMHLCLVHPPMHMAIRELQYRDSSHRPNKLLLRWTLFNLLNALFFLHDEANVVHTSINPSNIMLTVEDKSILNDFERAEREELSLTKVIDNARIIYGSRKLRLPSNSLWGQPALYDFGEARIERSHRGLIQPELYRAPEVSFDIEWSSSVDIWNVATLIWDLFENRHLFNAVDESMESLATHHIAEMVAYLGLPLLEYMQKSEITKKVFDEQGRWKGGGGVVVPQLSLGESVSTLDRESKEQFLNFISSMLH